jgi:chemotaxis response regulator CheB
MARALEPDVVVIDLRMPVLNGLDKGTMARRVHRVLLGAAVQAVLAGGPGG